MLVIIHFACYLSVSLSVASLAHYESSNSLGRGHGHHFHVLCLGVGLVLLLHQKVVDLLHVLVQEVGLLDESFDFNNSVEEASSDLTGHLSVESVDGEVDGVSDELQLLGTIRKGLKLLEVDLREGEFLHDSWRRLLLRHNLLLGVEFGVLAGREVVVGHDGVSLVSRHLVALHPGLVGSSVATVLRGTTSVVVAAVVAALTATTLLELTLVLVIVRVGALVVLHVATLSAVLLATHLPAHVHLVATLGLIANLFSMSDPVHHLVLFLLVTLVLELLLAHPEID